jgi:hypothetical protein
MANLAKAVLQKVYKFAIRTELCDTNPFLGIERFKSGSHHTWNEVELKQFEEKWKVGTRQRLAYALCFIPASVCPTFAGCANRI